MWCNLCQKEIGKRYPVEAILLPDYGNSQRRTQTPSKSLKKSIFRFCEIYWEYARSSKLIKIGINLSIDKSIKIGKSDLIDIDCIDQSVEIDDTLVSFFDLFKFYRFQRFLSGGRHLFFCPSKNENWFHANSEFVDNWVASESRRIKQFVITFQKKF